MEEAHIVEDVEASSHSESMHLKASPLSEALISKSSLQCELDNVNQTEYFTIFRTPQYISQSKKNLFEPSVVSIGPFHHDQKQLQAMEEQKRQSLQEEDQIVEDVEASPLSEASRQHELDTLGSKVNEAENFTIFRTPHYISQSKKNLFEPSVISIGPFHHGQKHLRALEEQKRRFLRDFLSRMDHRSLDLCISEMKLLETRTRRCYSETFDDLDRDTFVEMMLLDGCFLLEYFLKMMEGNPKSIVEVGWNWHFIRRDLVLLENQIPFFIVEKLCELIGFNPGKRMIFFNYLARKLLPNYILPTPPAETPDTIASTIADPPAEIHHFVHLCYDYLVPNLKKPDELSFKSFDLTAVFSANRIKGFLHRFLSRVLIRRSSHSTPRGLSVAFLNSTENLPSMVIPSTTGLMPNSTKNFSSMVIPSATELKQKGVKFKPKSNPKHMLDISFKCGVLKIPRLQIMDDTKPIFANLIAFEHSQYGKENSPFTAFVAFLDNLVNTPNDVTILQECGIIENWLGSEENLTQFLNQITEDTFIATNHYLAKLNRKVNKYIGSCWNRQRAKLIQDYFSSPWAAISLVAAFILLVLTCIQTFYAVYAYKFPPSS